MLMNIKKYIVLLMFFIFSDTSPAFAQLNIPTTGMLYNTKEASLLTYNCNQLNNGKLECEFIQTSVRKKLKAEDMAQKIEEEKKRFPDALKEISSEKMCTDEFPYIAVLTGEKTPEEVASTASKEIISNKEEFIQGMKDMSQSQKDELIKTFGALKTFCKEKTEKSYLDFTRLSLEKDSRTCIISAGYSFKQTFTHIQDGSSDEGICLLRSKLRS